MGFFFGWRLDKMVLGYLFCNESRNFVVWVIVEFLVFFIGFGIK